MKIIRLFSLLTLGLVLLGSCATRRQARRVIYDDRPVYEGPVYGGPVYRRMPPRPVVVVPQGRPVYTQRVYVPVPRGNAYGHRKQIYRRYNSNRRYDNEPYEANRNGRSRGGR